MSGQRTWSTLGKAVETGDLLFNIILERSKAARLWTLVIFLTELYMQGVSVGLIANALKGHWLAIVFTFGIVATFYCLARFFLDKDF